MIEYDTATLNALIGDGTLVARRLVWISARERGTGDMASVGFWDGVDHATFTIGGVARTYLGAGAILDMQDLVYRTGLMIQPQELRVSPLHPAILLAIREYDARRAPIEIHRALFNAETRALIAPPHRIFKGFIEDAPIPSPPDGGDMGAISMSLVPATFALTSTLPMYKSDATQRRRGGDRARRYIDLTGQVTCLWGDDDVGASDSVGSSGTRPRYTGWGAATISKG